MCLNNPTLEASLYLECLFSDPKSSTRRETENKSFPKCFCPWRYAQKSRIDWLWGGCGVILLIDLETTTMYLTMGYRSHQVCLHKLDKIFCSIFEEDHISTYFYNHSCKQRVAPTLRESHHFAYHKALISYTGMLHLVIPCFNTYMFVDVFIIHDFFMNFM